jgi:hypothetical protein
MKSMQKYKNQWVSVTRDFRKVIAHSEKLDNLVRILKRMGNPDGVILKITDKYTSYVG